MSAVLGHYETLILSFCIKIAAKYNIELVAGTFSASEALYRRRGHDSSFSRN